MEVRPKVGDTAPDFEGQTSKLHGKCFTEVTSCDSNMNGFRARDIAMLLVSIFVCQFAGVVGSVFTTPAIPAWYASLKKPFFTPPSWVFAPVWTTLFTLMGISLYIVWKKGFSRHDVRRAVNLFGIQLVLNVLWSVVFFGMQSPLYGFVMIVLLWIALLATIVVFYRISKAAGALLIPYLLWGSFASLLNFSILVLNA